MEPNKNVRDLITQRSYFSSLTTEIRKHILLNMNTKSFVSRLSTVVFFLFFVLLLNNISASSSAQNNRSEYEPNNLMDFWKGAIEETETLKNCAWQNWMMRLESDWEQFNASMNIRKDEWLKETEAEWDEWIKSIKNKWMNCNEYMDVEIKSDILSKSSTWNETQWKEWIHTEGKQLMVADFENWIKEKESLLDFRLISEWVQWKNDKIMTWLMSDWKSEENNYWSHWENETWPKWFNISEWKRWLKWKERVAREGQQWMNWIQLKENVYISGEGYKWSEWKKEKKIVFEKCTKSLIDEWINNKKWMLLTEKSNKTDAQE
ncbi:tryptophan-rich protein [Plasmodium brasilianum]|uniref:Tryptophan-rich protein n=1 Tax=Plasmodium brasilianum TaxID=5824 RepID=A0ACB9YCP8_PLABR|nr:tryptophan-rich protein [Plasmodium brasilianum]